jgi:hypothetical protein
MYLEIDDYDEYAASLSLENQAKVAAFAAAIAGSWLTSDAVKSVSVIGHADQALRIPASERQKKEMEVSVERANTAANHLRAAIALLPGGAAIRDSVHFLTSGVGSRERKYRNPTSDGERRKNRRVEITTVSSSGGIVHVLPEWPRRESQGEDPPLDKVFSVKLMEGVSSPSLFQYTFTIWDKTESRAGAFDYRGLKASAGVSSPFASESDWSDFLVRPGTSLEDVDGAASHSATTAPVGFMLLNLPQASVVIPLGLAMGASVESGTGLFTLDATSIKQPFHD